VKKISVLLSVKDGENFISKTIDSILNQTYKNIELIIIVNCSKDQTLDIENPNKKIVLKLLKIIIFN